MTRRYMKEVDLAFSAVSGKDKEKQVIGENGQAATVTVRLMVGAGNSATAQRQDSNFVLEICVDSARHLPQKDFLFGSCDPFVTVDFASRSYKTEVGCRRTFRALAHPKSFKSNGIQSVMKTTEATAVYHSWMICNLSSLSFHILVPTLSG
jgi:hypothetical protein